MKGKPTPKRPPSASTVAKRATALLGGKQAAAKQGKGGKK